MAETLGLLVTTDKHLDYITKIVDAAYAKGKDIEIFFTGKGVLLTLESDFRKLAGKARLSVCDVSFRANGLNGREEDVPDIDFKDFATQARNAEMIARVDRYLVF